MAATEAKTTFTMPVKIIGAIGLLFSTIPTGYGENAHPVAQLMCLFRLNEASQCNCPYNVDGYKQTAKSFGQSALALAIVLQGVHYLNTK